MFQISGYELMIDMILLSRPLITGVLMSFKIFMKMWRLVTAGVDYCC